MGRPTALTKEIIAEVEKILPAVLYLETVGDLLGVERSTWRKWVKRGAAEAKRLRSPSAKPKPEETLYLEFFYAHKKGRAQGEFDDAEKIRKAAESQWQAAAWRLERRFPERWGRDRDLLRELVKRVRELEAKTGVTASAAEEKG